MYVTGNEEKVISVAFHPSVLEDYGYDSNKREETPSVDQPSSRFYSRSTQTENITKLYKTRYTVRFRIFLEDANMAYSA